MPGSQRHQRPVRVQRQGMRHTQQQEPHPQQRHRQRMQQMQDSALPGCVQQTGAATRTACDAAAGKQCAGLDGKRCCHAALRLPVSWVHPAWPSQCFHAPPRLHPAAQVPRREVLQRGLLPRAMACPQARVPSVACGCRCSAAPVAAPGGAWQLRQLAGCFILGIYVCRPSPHLRAAPLAA